MWNGFGMDVEWIWNGFSNVGIGAIVLFNSHLLILECQRGM